MLSGGWLNKYDYGDFGDGGEQGDNLNQYTLGLNLEHILLGATQWVMPGVSGYLSGVFYQTDSEVVHTGYEETEPAGLYEKYKWEYSLGGGKQYEALAGVTLDWNPVTFGGSHHLCPVPDKRRGLDHRRRQGEKRRQLGVKLLSNTTIS